MADETPAKSVLCNHCDQLLTLFSSDSKTLSPEQNEQRRFPNHYDFFDSLKDSAGTCPVCADLLEATHNHLKAPRVWRETEATGGDLTFSSYSIGAFRGPSQFWSESALEMAGITAGRVKIGYYPDDPYFCFLVRKETEAGLYLALCLYTVQALTMRQVHSGIEKSGLLKNVSGWMTDCHCSEIG